MKKRYNFNKSASMIRNHDSNRLESIYSELFGDATSSQKFVRFDEQKVTVAPIVPELAPMIQEYNDQLVDFPEENKQEERVFQIEKNIFYFEGLQDEDNIKNAWANTQNDYDGEEMENQTIAENLTYLRMITPAEDFATDKEDDHNSFEGNFDLITIIYESLERLANIGISAKDGNESLSSSMQSTKEKFAQALNTFSILHHVKPSAMSSLLGLLNEHVPEVNWPIHLVEESGNVINDISKYCEEDSKMLEFHVCPDKGCCVFVGDYATLNFCPFCKADRFRKCTHPSCKTKSVDECQHERSKKVAYKTLFYRPLISLILELLHTDGFISAINYNFLNKTNTHKYVDVSDGATYKKNLTEMISNYNKLFSNIPEKERPIMINLLFSQFYDGMQIYKKKHVTFWPFLVSILNLPPNYRVKLGIGLFLLSIFTSRAKSKVEDFLLRWLIVEELKVLNEGIMLHVKGKDYFVQARMILTILDTKAVEDFLKVQTCCAFAGCFCCVNAKGFNCKLKKLKRVVFIGHRQMTDLRHYCRRLGQSGQCCQKRYYENSNEDFEDVVIEDLLENQSNVIEITVPLRTNQLFEICDQANADRLTRWLRRPNNPWVWYHTDVDPDIFRNNLYYHHADYRPYLEYRRKNNQYYIACGKKAINEKLDHYNGVKGLWQMAELDYVDVATNVCWGPMHSLMNVSLNIILNMKGEREADNVNEFLKATNMHPDLFEFIEKKQKNGKIKIVKSTKVQKWEIAKSERDKVRIYLILRFIIF
jgi:hypothetical protein